MTILPEPQPTAPAAGQATPNPLADAVIRAAVDNAIHEARRHDTAPQAVIGTAPPVAQPGRAPMSSKAVDDSVRMLSAGAASLPIGGMTALILHVLGTVDPAQLAIGGAVPVALVLALSRLVKRAKDALPDEHHHHYNGPVYQDQSETRTENKGVWVKTNNPK